MSSGSYSMHDVEGNGSKSAYTEKSTDREKKLRIAVIVLAVLICALIIALILLATIGRKSAMEEICTDASCVKSANYLLNSMNTSADPCEDFYEFSCGKWIADHMEGSGTRILDIPGTKLQKDFKEIFNSAREQKDLPKSLKEIIKAFDACLKYDGLNAELNAWIKNKTHQAGGFPLIDKNYRRSNALDWTDLLVKQFNTNKVAYPISISVSSNPLDSSENIIIVAQPEMESDLPPLDRDSLFEIGIMSQGQQNNVSVLKDIDEIMWFKETVTNLSRPSTELMEDEEEFELVTIEKLNSMYPEVNWLDFLTDYFENYLQPGVSINKNDKVFLTGKTYIGKIIKLLESKKISERMILNYGGATLITTLMYYNWKDDSTLELNLKRRRTSSSSDEKFSQCIEFLTKTISPALDYLYGKHRKEKTINKELIDYMVKAMKEMVDQSTWLDEETKKAVQDKLNHMVAFLSLPPWTQDIKQLEEYFKDLPKMTDNTFENMVNLQQFDIKHTISFYKRKNNRSKWPKYSEMGGSQVNAFYVPDFNIILIPAGIQQLPYYHPDRPNFMNFGGMGLIYGHEMTHGLDESGSLRDKYGNLKDWWTEKSKAEFKKRSKCFVDQYSSYKYSDELDVTVDGKQTLSENIADNGGLRQAYLGYQKWVKDHGKEKRLPGLEKYSPEQLFFVAFAESWCSSLHPPSHVATSHADDSHSADKFRVVGSLVNMKEFAEVYKCKPGSKMNPKNKCIIW